MRVRACTVGFKGVSGITTAAETVCEAAIRGLHLLRKDGWVDNVGPGTELEIRVERAGNDAHRFRPPAPALVLM